MATLEWAWLVEDVGERDFSTTDHPVGHGDPDRTRQWCDALGLPRTKGDYSPPKGFVWLQDAECIAVALVPVELAPHFLRLLNYDGPCSVCQGSGFVGPDLLERCPHHNR